MHGLQTTDGLQTVTVVRLLSAGASLHWTRAATCSSVIGQRSKGVAAAGGVAVAI